MDAPKILKDSRHWLLRKGNEPVGILGNAIRWDNPNTWMSYEDATVAYEQNKGRYDGIGYIVMDDDNPLEQPLTESIIKMGDPREPIEEIYLEELDSSKQLSKSTPKPKIAGINLDYCRDPITREVSCWAEWVLRRLNSPTSVNVAGNGFIVFCICPQPLDTNVITGFGADDLSKEAKDNLAKFEPDVASRLLKGKPAFNQFEIHQVNPQHFAITGEWLEEYPQEMEDRTEELAMILILWTPFRFEDNLEHIPGDSTLPHLDILKVIDTRGFTKVGDAFVGRHPLFYDKSCKYIKVNPVDNNWYFFDEGKRIIGESWLWLAAESGSISLMDIMPGMLSDEIVTERVKDYAIVKGYFTEEELFPEGRVIEMDDVQQGDDVLDEPDAIAAERMDIEEQIDAELNDKRPNNQHIVSLNKRLKQLDQLEKIEDSRIKAKAIEILKSGDPIAHIIKVYNRLHVGDTGIGKVLLLSIACQSVLNSEGLQPKLSGGSGKGKTHAAKAMFHLIPDVGYKLEGSLSAKSLFYHPDLKAGTVVFSDDVKMSDELEDTLKRAMSNFQQKTKHNTVDKNRDYSELEIPERVSWWLTSVANPFSDELLNRLFGLNVDDSVEMDTRVTEEQLKNAESGEVSLPEDEDVTLCRAIIHIIKGKLLQVDIPYAKLIVWKASDDRRNLPRFLDLIRAFAVLRFMQRIELTDNEIGASLEDFEDAKKLFEEGQASLTTKLTAAELRLVKGMVGKSWLSYDKIQQDYKKPNGESYTYEAIRKLIRGDKNRKGLTSKVPALRQRCKDGKNEFCIESFDDKSHDEIVSLKPEAYKMYR